MRYMMLIAVFGLASCAYQEKPAALASGQLETETAPEATGKADSGHPWIVGDEDVCETFGLYEDEFCDTYCPQVDPACDATEYEEEEGPNCFLESITCDEGEVPIDTDDNTCGDTCVQAEVGCATNTDCAEGDYCAQPTGECGASVGTCQPMPTCEIDIDEWKPTLVCGCDGVTYAMPCDAASVGVNVLHDGLCEELQ